MYPQEYFRKMQNVFNNLLVILCLADLLVILSSFIHALHYLSVPLAKLAVLSDGVSHIAVSMSPHLLSMSCEERLTPYSKSIRYSSDFERSYLEHNKDS